MTKILSQAQTKYITERLNAVKLAKLRAIETEYKDDLNDVLAAEIRAGRVKLIPEKLERASMRTDLFEVLFFKKYNGGWKEVEKVVKKSEAQREVRSDKVRDEMARIMDQVMLGDAEQALQMLQDFSAKSF